MIINAEVGLEEGGYGLEVDYWSFGILLYEMLVGVTPFNDSNPRSIYRRILYAPLELPWSMDPLAKDIIRRLLTRFPKSRLGYGAPHRIEDIKRHRWFKGIDWDLLRKREVPSPFVPRILHPGDTSNFLPYMREKLSIVKDINFGDAFRDF